MRHRPTAIVSVHAMLIAAWFLTAAIAWGSPPPTPPGPGQPGYCGAHTDPLDCWSNTGPETPGETAFIDLVRGHIPGDDTRLLQVARGTCQMLIGGDATWYIVQDMSEELGVSHATAGQVMDAAMEDACPGLTVGADGVAKPSG